MSEKIENLDLSLDAPSTFVFTGEICSRSYGLNRFAFAFKDPKHRERFEQDPEALMQEFGLTDEQKALVR